jgi:hypothetical protein
LPDRPQLESVIWRAQACAGASFGVRIWLRLEACTGEPRSQTKGIDVDKTINFKYMQQKIDLKNKITKQEL